MEIRLGESDAFLRSDGRAHMIIIHVTLDSGKQVQFPYEADKPISELYESVKNITDEKIVVPLATVPLVSVATPAAEVSLSSSVAVPPVEDNQISREDLVRCIKVEPRAKDAPVDIEVGHIYRVLKVHGPILTINGKPKKIIDGFDIIDDSSDTPRRILLRRARWSFIKNGSQLRLKLLENLKAHSFALIVLFLW